MRLYQFLISLPSTCDEEGRPKSPCISLSFLLPPPQQFEMEQFRPLSKQNLGTTFPLLSHPENFSVLVIRLFHVSNKLYVTLDKRAMYASS